MCQVIPQAKHAQIVKRLFQAEWYNDGMWSSFDDLYKDLDLPQSVKAQMVTQLLSHDANWLKSIKKRDASLYFKNIYKVVPDTAKNHMVTRLLQRNEWARVIRGGSDFATIFKIVPKKDQDKMFERLFQQKEWQRLATSCSFDFRSIYAIASEPVQKKMVALLIREKWSGPDTDSIFSIIFSIAKESKQAEMIHRLLEQRQKSNKSLWGGKHEFTFLFKTEAELIQSQMLLRLFVQFPNEPVSLSNCFFSTLESIKELIRSYCAEGSVLHSICDANTITDLHEKILALIENHQLIANARHLGQAQRTYQNSEDTETKVCHLGSLPNKLLTRIGIFCASTRSQQPLEDKRNIVLKHLDKPIINT